MIQTNMFNVGSEVAANLPGTTHLGTPIPARASSPASQTPQAICPQPPHTATRGRHQSLCDSNATRGPPRTTGDHRSRLPSTHQHAM